MKKKQSKNLHEEEQLKQLKTALDVFPKDSWLKIKKKYKKLTPQDLKIINDALYSVLTIYQGEIFESVQESLANIGKKLSEEQKKVILNVLKERVKEKIKTISEDQHEKVDYYEKIIKYLRLDLDEEDNNVDVNIDVITDEKLNALIDTIDKSKKNIINLLFGYTQVFNIIITGETRLESNLREMAVIKDQVKTKEKENESIEQKAEVLSEFQAQSKIYARKKERLNSIGKKPRRKFEKLRPILGNLDSSSTNNVNNNMEKQSDSDSAHEIPKKYRKFEKL